MSFISSYVHLTRSTIALQWRALSCLKNRFILSVLCLSVLSISACSRTETALISPPQKETTNSKTVKPFNEKRLTIVTRPSLHTFLEKPRKETKGLEFSLMQTFAKKNNLNIDIILASNEKEVFQAIDEGHADIALLGQPLSRQQDSQYLASTAYMDVTTQLIYRHGKGKPKSFEDLIGKRILVQNLEHYRNKHAFLDRQYAGMNWEFSDDSPEALLAQVNKGNVAFALIGSHEFLELRSKFPRTRAAFDLYYPEGLTVLINPTSKLLNKENALEGGLLTAMNNFIDASLQDGTVAHLEERYLGHAEDINPLGSMTFFKRVNRRLPHYQDLIERVAKDFKLDWRLLAAIAYQESHWNPNAESPTGVRGMMMLTKKTAADLGIENRLDLSQSLRGGAEYFSNLHKRLPKGIKEPDRTWFALAAYNVGIGHIYDARKITKFHGGNVDHWADVKQYLPLLERKEWYQYTHYGYARGNEPVNYVQNIRHFHDLLEWRFPNNSRYNHQTPTQISVKEVKDVIKDARRETNDEHRKLTFVQKLTQDTGTI
ncbi:MAG: membrane-bound lytic murein transglycosylase MltF [Sinobacterium sp.]|nr:membrane-bound lytic murein transglycosylase MltF [Sinobacterium sp.]